MNADADEGSLRNRYRQQKLALLLENGMKSELEDAAADIPRVSSILRNFRDT